jgi:hypothetical protein
MEFKPDELSADFDVWCEQLLSRIGPVGIANQKADTIFADQMWGRVLIGRWLQEKQTSKPKRKRR